MKTSTQYKLIELAGKSWIYVLLIAGSIIFSWPFLWMATTSVKVDREMFSERIRLWPQQPIPASQSPYIDTRYFTDLAGPGLAELLPALEQKVTGLVPADAVQQVARGCYKKLVNTLPSDKLVPAAAEQVDAAMVKDVLNQVRRHLSIGQLRARSYDLQEDQLVNPAKVAEAWQVTGPGKLIPVTDDREPYADLHYDFSTGNTIELSQTFTTSFDVARLHRIELSLRSDDSWHPVTVFVEKQGQRLEAVRTYDLSDFNWGIGTWQEPGPDDKSNKIKTWRLLDPVGTSAVTDPRQMKITIQINKTTALGAWWAKASRNYRLALDHIPFWRYVATSLFLIILNMVGTLFSCSLVAYSFARLQWPGRAFCFALMLATMMIPGQVTMIPNFLIMKHLGWYNTLYPLWVGSFFAGAFNVFLLRQFLKGIPRDLEDAAKIDGCGFWRIYWHLMLPLIKPTLAAIAIFTFMGAWNDFMGPLIFLSDQRLYPLSLGLYAFNVQAGGSMGMMMAGSLLMTVPVIIIFFFAQKYFIQGITLTGMKG
ncbi:MAG: ABC transporter permease subunit [Verrucomicrobiota bacterium]